jgi:resolvase-like protein
MSSSSALTATSSEGSGAGAPTVIGRVIVLVCLATVAMRQSLPERPRPFAGWTRRLGLRAGRATIDPTEGPEHTAPWAAVDPPPVLGYATVSPREARSPDDQLARQADIIVRACDQRGLGLVEVVGDPQPERRLFRPKVLDAPPGLRYAIEQIDAGDVSGLVVQGLRRLAQSAAELGPLVEWFTRRDARLIAVAQGFDTGEDGGRIAARLIVEVSRWERERFWDPTSEGRSPSTGTPACFPSDDEPDERLERGGASS